MRNEIFRVLEKDARLTGEEISSMTGIPEDEVKHTIREAEENRIILKYKTIINWDKADEERVFALIEVKIAPQKNVGFDAIAEHICRFPQAHEVYLFSGAYDLLVFANGKTMHDISEFVSQNLAPIEGVQGTVTHIMLKKYKEDGETLTAKEEIKRQKVIL